MFSLTEIAAHVGQSIGKTVNSQWISAILKDIDPRERFTPSTRFTAEQRDIVTLYAREWNHKSNQPGLKAWIQSHGFQVPNPFFPPAVVKQEKKKAEKRLAATDPILRNIQKKLDTLEKQVSIISNKPKLALIEGGHAREKETDPLIKKIQHFTFNHPASIDQVWNRLQELFEIRNSIKVRRIQQQTFPQWLRHEGYLGMMMDQIQGYLDQMHDEFTGQRRLM